MTAASEAVRFALAEDIGSGDVTTQACVPAGRQADGVFLARQPLVLAGTSLLAEIYAQQGGVESLEIFKPDGATVEAEEVFATVRGSARTLLTCERVALNFLQRLSGVATLARSFAERVAGTGCRVLDTRKTTPGLRELEKQAAAAGGVSNHRMGLWDAILIKNNHISAAGGVAQALAAAARESVLPVEIEVRTEAERDEALRLGAKHLLLDNLTPEQARAWIQVVAGRATVELSGNISLATVRAYAETGAQFVSAGAITHSAPAVDISFRLSLR
jgi:nicotinate-nucleotide pyrophosphorylase (carboxylating)